MNIEHMEEGIYTPTQILSAPPPTQPFISSLIHSLISSSGARRMIVSSVDSMAGGQRDTGLSLNSRFDESLAHSLRTGTELMRELGTVRGMIIAFACLVGLVVVWYHIYFILGISLLVLLMLFLRKSTMSRSIQD